MKRIFYITLLDITVFHWDKNTILDAVRFPANENSQAEFLRYIEREPKTLSYALVDLVEEEFHAIQIPKLSSITRTPLVQRKLDAFFRSTPFRIALYQGKHASKPKQDEILLTGLTNPDTLSLLLSWIQLCQVPLQGIYSIPLISPKIQNTIKSDDEYSLLVSQQANGYLRQTFFHNQNIKSSRLSKLKTNNSEDFATTIMTEVQNNQRYLNRFHLLPHNKAFTINIICDDQNHDVLRSGLDNTNNWTFNLIHIDKLNSTFHLKSPVSAKQTEMLFVHLLAKFRFKDNYAVNHDKRYFIFEKANSILTASSILLLIATVAYSSQSYVKTQGLKAQIQLVKQKTLYLARHINKINQDTPDSLYTANGIRQAVYLNKRLASSEFKVEKLFSLISDKLVTFPDIEISNISWKTSYKNPIVLKPVNADENEESNESDETQEESAIYRIVTIKARFKQFQGDYIYAFNTTKRFASTFTKSAGVNSVKILQLPISVKTTELSRGKTGTSYKNKPSDFTLQIIFRKNLNEI